MSLRKNITLFEELEELANKTEKFLEETGGYSQATYQVVCEIGRNQHNHTTKKLVLMK